MDLAGVFFAALMIVVAIPFAFVLYRQPEGNKTTGTIALIAGVLHGAVNVIRSLGLMTDGPVYWTLNTALVVLFWVMLIQFLRGSNTARRKNGQAL